MAKELDPGSLSTTASVLVYLNDVNDNPPQFQKTKYMVQIPENITANTVLVEVKTTDVDTGLAGSVHYTQIVGYRNGSLLLNSITGAITIATDNHGFDREESSGGNWILALSVRVPILCHPWETCLTSSVFFFFFQTSS